MSRKSQSQGWTSSGACRGLMYTIRWAGEAGGKKSEGREPAPIFTDRQGSFSGESRPLAGRLLWY